MTTEPTVPEPAVPDEVERARIRADLLSNAASRGADMDMLIRSLKRHDVLSEQDRRVIAALLVAQCRVEIMALLGVEGGLRVLGLREVDDLLPRDGETIPASHRHVASALREAETAERRHGLEVSPRWLSDRRRTDRLWGILQRMIDAP